MTDEGGVDTYRVVRSRIDGPGHLVSRAGGTRTACGHVVAAAWLVDRIDPMALAPGDRCRICYGVDDDGAGELPHERKDRRELVAPVAFIVALAVVFAIWWWALSVAA